MRTRFFLLVAVALFSAAVLGVEAGSKRESSRDKSPQTKALVSQACTKVAAPSKCEAGSRERSESLSTHQMGGIKPKPVSPARDPAGDESDWLSIGGYRFNAILEKPQIPSNQMASGRMAESAGGRLVKPVVFKFSGPASEKWVEEMEAKGVELIQYQAHDGFLALAGLDGELYLRNSAPISFLDEFHGAYKIDREISDLMGKENSITLGVVFFDLLSSADRIREILTSGARLAHQDTARATSQWKQLTYCIFENFNTGNLESLINSPEVYNAYVWHDPELEGERAAQIVAGNYSGTTPSTGYYTWLAGLGADGAGVTIAVADSGLDTGNASTVHLDVRGRVTYATSLCTTTDDPNGHGTNCTSIAAGDPRASSGGTGITDTGGFYWGGGSAPEASIYSQPAIRGTPCTNYNANANTLADDAVRIGGSEIGTHSFTDGLGDGTSYNSQCAAWDARVRDADTTTGGNQPYAVIFSAGNSGPSAGTLTSPKAAKNIITVGATDNYRSGECPSPDCGAIADIDTLVSFSSRGPTADSRIKPEVCAPGHVIAGMQSSVSTGTCTCDGTGTGCCDYGVAGTAPNRYCRYSGTSQASPRVAGVSGIVFDWWANNHSGAFPSPAMNKALLINGAVDMKTADVPNSNEGWGRVNLKNSVQPTAATFYKDQDTIIGTTGSTGEFSVDLAVADTGKPVKATLVWTDPPGAVSCNPCLINNLNLTLTSGATTYLGNVFSGGWSTTGGTADSRNNMECIFLQTGSISGTFTLKVTAAALNGDGVPGNADTTDQDFALVLFNAMYPCTAPTVSVTPNGTTTVCTGANITFTASASGGTPPYTYQWTENGTDIGGATNSTLTRTKAAPGTFNYNCKVLYSGCPVAGSDATDSVGTWQICGPYIVYSAHGSFTAVDTNGTGGMEAGEKYSVSVTLTNAGTVSANNVTASLSGMTDSDGITVCNNPGIFGTIAVGGTASYTFTFVVNPSVWYSKYACLSNLTFNIVSKSTTTAGCTCPDEMAVFSQQILGTQGSNEVVTSAGGNPPKGVTTTYTLSPNTTLSGVATATTSYTAVSYTRITAVNLQAPGGAQQALTTPTANTTYTNDVTAFYNTNGPGQYAMLFTCQTGPGTPSVNALSLTLVPAPTCATWTASCVACPMTVDVTPNGTTTVCTGANIIFTATQTGGTGPFTYQWTENGADISGATNSTYTANKAAAGSFTYNCKVDAVGCTDITDPTASTGTWVAPPTVTVTPSGTTTVCTGASIIFTATAAGGTAPYTYQWTENGSNISGATNSTYTANKAATGSFTYTCNVYSTGCATAGTDATPSTGAWVAPPTSVTVTPSGTTTVCTGANIVFTATVVGGATPVYQWTENGSNIAGATNSTYTANKAAAGSFPYTCIVNNTGCATTVTDATPSTGTWVVPPTVDVTPDGTTQVTIGTSITFTVTASGGTAPYTYQWTRDGGDIAGATNSTLTETYGTVQTHTYNCKVASTGCATVAQDAAASTGDWISAGCTDPAEVSNQQWTDITTHTWDDLGVTYYLLYRGQMANLADLPTGVVVNSCNVAATASTSVTLSEDPTGLAAGDFYWYLVIGHNDPDCNGTPGANRVINSSGPCL